MPIRPISLRALLLSALLCATGAPPVAQIGDLRLPISLDADSADYDGKSSMMLYRGLKLSQGSIGVEADLGRASQVDFEDSVWQFSGNVRIDTGQGRIRCDSADLRFAGHQLRIATINGTPATFELRRADSDEITYGEAGRLKYDFGAGVVEFSDNATITEGGNRISSNYLVYNIAEQRINAESRGGDGEKVKIVYTPGVNGANGANALPAGGDDQPDDSTAPPPAGTELEGAPPDAPPAAEDDDADNVADEEQQAADPGGVGGS